MATGSPRLLRKVAICSSPFLLGLFVFASLGAAGTSPPDLVGPVRRIPSPPAENNPAGDSASGAPGVPGLTESPLVAQQYALTMLGFPQAWSFEAGQTSVVVAVIDSGLERTHPDLEDRVWRNSREIANGFDDDSNGFVDDLHGWDFVQNDSDPQDEADHGTHVAGIIAAAGRYRRGVAGVANVTIMPLRVLDANRQGVDSDVARAINYAVQMGADVINVSLGGEQPNANLRQACAAAEAAGVVVVAAAGNQGESSVLYPAAYDTVIGVAAIDETGATPAFSNYGHGVKLAAPGVNILSTVRNGQYGFRSGTSMATAYISGIAALLKSRDANLTAGQIRNTMAATSDDINQQGWDLETGYGRANALRALTEAPRGDGAPAPAVASTLVEANQVSAASQEVPTASGLCGAGVFPFMLLSVAGMMAMGRGS